MKTRLLALLFSVFTVVNLSSQNITVTSPNGGEVWAGCTSKNITWTASGTSNNYTIDYSTDGGTNWTSVTSSLSTTSGSFAWTVPNINSSTCLVRIKDSNTPSIVDQSNSSFTITAPLILTSPNGSESWEAGTSKSITWAATGTSNRYNIQYSTNGGSNWTTILSNYYNTSGIYNWTVPNSQSTTALVQVTDYYTSCMTDKSDNLFTIAPPTPTLALTSPNGGQVYYTGQSYNISWSAANLVSNLIALDYSIDSGNTWIPIVTGVANSGSHAWTVPNTVSTSCLVKVKNVGTSLVDSSNSYFTIRNPYINVTYPNGGENFQGCNSYTIRWANGGVTNRRYNIHYSLDNGVTWTSIASNVYSSSTTNAGYTWAVPNTISGTAQIRVSDYNNASTFGITTTSFNISNNTSIIVTSPTGGEQWEAGTTKLISWVDNGRSRFRVWYSSNAGSTWSYITSNTYGNSINWSVPNTPSTNYLIRVRDYYTACYEDQSDSLFTVTPPTPIITVTTPNGGQTYYPGESRSINWSSSYLTSSFVKTEYSVDSGATWVVNSSVTANDGSDAWTVPNNISTKCLVRVSEYGNAALNDVSNSTFTIAAPHITLNSPNGGEIWKGCESKSISWTVGGGSGTYRLEYSLDSGSTWVYISNRSGTNYNWSVPSKLSSTKAFIRIQDLSRGISDQSNSKFSFVPNTDIIITDPVGGEQWEAGTTERISWVDNNLSSFRVYYSVNGGSSYSYVTSYTTSNYVNWSVPNNPGANYKIKVQDYSNSCKYDESDSTFTVLPPQPVINVTAPNGNSLFPQASYSIRWSSSYLNSSFVNIDFSSDSGATWSSIVQTTSNDGIHSWTVPNTISTNCFIRVTESGSPTVYDWSGRFSIVQPYLTLLTPNGGEVWKGCESKNISWAVGGGSGTYRLEYSLDSGSTWVYIANRTGSNYNWSLPTKISSYNGFIRIRDISRGMSDMSNSRMTFLPNSDIIVTSPNGGEQWEVGQTKRIEWVDNGISQFRVRYSSNGGSSYSYITTYTSSNYVNWSVPNNPGANYIVKVEDYYSSCKYDISDSIFAVTPPTPVITVTSPNGGQTYYPSESRSINWSSSYLTSAFVKTEYSVDSGATWLVNSAVTANDGSDPWSVPNVISSKCLVRVSEYGNAALNDVSNATFSIAAPHITLTSPNGGEIWKGCESKSISWTVGGGSGTYRLEYSLDSGSTWVYISNRTGTNYNWSVPSKLSSTKAFIRIRDLSRGISDQSNSKFSFVPNTDIILTDPVGGEQWEAGTTERVSWVDNGISQFRVYYSSNGGSTYNYITSYTTSNFVNWSVPNSPGSNYKIKVQDYYNSCKYDESDSVFTVLPPQPVITVTYPNGQTLYPQGSYSIRWTSQYLNSSFVNIDFSSDSGSTWSSVVQTTSNDGAHNWIMPNAVSNNCFIRVTESGSPTVYDWSGKFTIAQPYLTLTSPNGGEVWKGCESKSISWSVGGGSGTYRLEYSLDSGSTWVYIANRTGSSYSWSLPTKISSYNGFIRVRDLTRGMSDMSNSRMTFLPNSDIIISDPVGGEQWKAGTSERISWVDNGISQFRVRYSSNNGSSYSYVTSYTSSNYVNWTVPNVPGTNYKIKVEDYYNSCKYDESDSVFTVLPPTPYITVTSPNGGNTLYQGQSSTVYWSSGHLTSPYVRVDYSLDSGLTWNVISNITNNDGSESWSVPNVSSTKALIRVSEYGNASMNDVSNAPFTIKPSITLLSPNGNNGQVDYRGCTVTSITWQAGGTSRYYRLYYSLNGGSTWTTINSNYYSTSSNPIYNWTMPNSGSKNVLVRVQDRNDASKVDQSDFPFSISLPIKLNTPNNGETFYVGDTVLIDWTSNGTSNYYNIDYTVNGGTTWTSIAFNHNTSGNTYQWIVPNSISNNALIRITDNISSCKKTQSSVPFKIVSGSRKIVVNEPSGGEFWNGCTQQQIKWTDSGNSATYKIEYSSNSGSTWTTIQNSYGSASRTYNWTVPSQTGVNYLIRVSDASDATKTDQSDSTFEVGVVATPTASAVGVTTICNGSSVTLTCDRSSGIAWYPGGLTTQTISVTTPGNYYVIATDTNSCSVQSNSIQVLAGTPPAVPTITASGATKFCLGGSVILSTNQTSGIKWYPGGQTSQTITATQGGAYTVTYTDQGGCSATSLPTNISTNSTPTITRSSAGVCLGDSLVLTSSSQTGNVWFPTSDTTRSITVSTNGNYKVQVTDNDNCVATSNEDTVLFLAPPAKPTILAIGSTSFCKGETVKLIATPKTNVTWSTGVTDSSITVDSNAAITVSYQNAGGCASVSDPINTSLLAAPTKPVVSIIGDSVICNGDSVSLASNASSNFWSDSSNTNTIVVKSTGYYSTTTTGSNGCKSTSQPKLITVNPTPLTPQISVSGSSTFCTGDSVLLISNQTSGNVWSTNATTTSIVVKSAGSYSVDFTNQYGCTNSSSPVNVVVNNAPVVPTISNNGGTAICAGDSVVLSSSFNGKARWSTGDSSNSIVVKSSGNYNVSAIGTNGCSSTSGFTNIQVNQIPATPTIIVSDTNSLCTGDTITLSSTASNGNRWSTGDSTSSIKVASSGTYELYVENSSGCSSANTSKVLTFGTVPAKPTISINGDTTLCMGDSSILVTSGVNPIWSTNSNTASIVVKSTGYYSVKTTSNNGCSSVSDQVYISVNSLPSQPVVSASGILSFCTGDSVVLTSNVSNGIAWNNNATTASIVVKTSGTYDVTTTNSAGCTSTSSPVAVTVKASPSSPEVTASGVTSFCDGGSVLLSSSAGSNNVWSSGDSTSSINVTQSGSFSVQTISSNGCAAASNNILVNVLPLPAKPILSVTGDTTFCVGDSAILTSNVSSGILWNNNATSPSITVKTSGTYSIQSTNSSGCSATSDAITINVKSAPAVPIVTANGLTSFCDGGSVLLSSSAGSNNVWSSGDSTSSINVTQSGSYSVQTISSNGCASASNNILVNVLPLPAKPILSVTGDTTFCVGDSAILTSNVSSGILWNNNATSPSITVKASGTYSIQSTNSSGCSATSDAITINVKSAPAVPVVTANGLTSFCDGGSVLLSSSAGSNNVWSSGDSTSSINVSQSGSYSVQVVLPNGCSASSNSILVSAKPTPQKPLITINGDTSFCSGDSVTLTANFNNGVLWNTMDTSSSIVVKSAGAYSVKATNNFGCFANSDLIVIAVHNAPSVPVISANGITAFCDGGNVVLSSSAATNNKWSNGDTTNSIVVAASGNYSVEVSSLNNCSATSLPTTVTVNALPVRPQISLIGDSSFCADDSVSLVTNYSNNLKWSTGDTTNSLVAKTSGIYSVEYTDANGCKNTSLTKNVTVYNNPTIPVITASGPLTFCAGGSVNLTSSSASNNKWSNGIATNSIGVSSSGNYNVKVINANGCEAVSQNVLVTVNALPAVPSISLIGDTVFCVGDSLSLVSSISNGIRWSTGDTVSTLVRKTSGTISLTRTDTNNCSAISRSVQVVSNPLPPTPSILAGGPTTFCDGNSVTLNSSSASNNKWSSNDSTASILVNSSGNYTVTAYNQFGCEATSSNLLVTVNPLPSKPAITASGATTICQGDSVILSSSSLVNNLWSTTATSSSVTAKSSGAYSLKLVDANLCESPLTTVNVLVNPVPSAPIVTAGGPIGFCQGDSVILTSSVINGNQWSQGDSVQNVTIKNSGTYFVKLVNSIGCEAISNSITVSVGNLPVTPSISAIGSTDFCAGDSVKLVSSGTKGNRWSTGDSSNSITVKSPGNISLKVFDNGCFSNSNTQLVNVFANPVVPMVTYTGDTAFCPGDSVTLHSSYQMGNMWSHGGGTVVSLVVKSTGSYQVTHTDSNGCFAASIPIGIRRFADAKKPFVSPGGSVDLCEGESIVLASDVLTGLSWDNNQSPYDTLVVSNAGVYFVNHTDANGCKAVSNTVTVSVNARPAPTTISLIGQDLVSTTASNYQWYMAGVAIAGEIGSLHRPTANGVYQVETSDRNGCTVLSAPYTFTSVGVSDASEGWVEGFKIFPNPSNGEFGMELNISQLQEFDLTIYSVEGKVVYRENIKPSSSSIIRNFELETLPQGMYQFELKSDVGRYSERIIIQK